MSLYDDYFTNNDKPFAENINTALLLSNVFDLTVGVEYPTMCSSQYWGDEESIKKCSVGIVTIKDYDGVTYSSSAITGTGTVKIGFYPNFNAFGKITAIEWTNSAGITCDVYSENGQLIQENVPNGTITTQSAGLGVLQNFELRFHLTSATLTKFKVTMANREDLRYGATVGISNVTGLQNSLNSKLDIAQGSTYANKDVVTDNNGNIIFSNKITKTSDLTNDGDGTYNFVKTNDSRLTDNRTPTSHTHGSIQNGGTLNDDIQGNNVNKIVVTDGSNNLKTITTLPLDHTTSITVDTSLSSTSTNPVQNKVINSALDGKSNTSHTHTYASLTSKPSSFTPSSHASSSTTYGVGSTSNYGHVKVDDTLSTGSTNPLQNKVVTNALNGKASSSHIHVISDVTNLQTTLNEKANTTNNVNSPATWSMMASFNDGSSNYCNGIIRNGFATVWFSVYHNSGGAIPTSGYLGMCEIRNTKFRALGEFEFPVKLHSIGTYREEIGTVRVIYDSTLQNVFLRLYFAPDVVRSGFGVIGTITYPIYNY